MHGQITRVEHRHIKMNVLMLTLLSISSLSVLHIIHRYLCCRNVRSLTLIIKWYVKCEAMTCNT